MSCLSELVSDSVKNQSLVVTTVSLSKAKCPMHLLDTGTVLTLISLRPLSLYVGAPLNPWHMTYCKAKSTVTFTAMRHCHPLTINKLYCTVTSVSVWTTCAESLHQSGVAWIQTHDFLSTSATSLYHHATQSSYLLSKDLNANPIQYQHAHPDRPLQQPDVEDGQVIGDITELCVAWLPMESSPEDWGELKEYLVHVYHPTHVRHMANSQRHCNLTVLMQQTSAFLTKSCH